MAKGPAGGHTSVLISSLWVMGLKVEAVTPKMVAVSLLDQPSALPSHALGTFHPGVLDFSHWCPS